MNFDIISVGSAGFDIFVSGKELKPGLLQNESAISLLDDHSYNIEHTVYETGGSGLNSALTFARQGIKTACLSKTGRDHLANQIKIVARHENIGTELFVNKPEHHTDMCIHIVTERMNEIRLNYLNSLHSLRGKDLRFPGLKTRVLYLAELPTDFKLAKFLALWARANGAQLVTHISSSSSYRPKQLEYLLKRSSKLLVQAYHLTQFGFDRSNAVDAIRYFQSLGIQSALVYDVQGSSYAFEDQTVYTVGQFRKTNPLDLTGASDVYAASYLAGLFQQKSVPEALTFASANAISVMSVMGTRSGILRKPALRTMKTQTTIL